MLLQPDCIPCILKMSISLIRKLSLEETLVKKLTADILKIPALRGRQWNITSPEVVEQVMQKIVAATGNSDPFSSEKSYLNTALLSRYGFFQNLLDQSDDPLNTAVKLAIFGNAIDVMVPKGASRFENNIMEKLDAPLPNEVFSTFKEKLDSSKLLLYIGDNAGEIVLDKLLIETIRQRYDLDVVFVVRSIPTLNDATMNESMAVGMDKVTRVIENGIDGPLPGTIVNRCSNELKDLFERAELIVAKGGGNFDSLSEEKKYMHKITFMLLSKCFPYNRHFDVPLFQPILSDTIKAV